MYKIKKLKVYRILFFKSLTAPSSSSAGLVSVLGSPGSYLPSIKHADYDTLRDNLMYARAPPQGENWDNISAQSLAARHLHLYTVFASLIAH